MNVPLTLTVRFLLFYAFSLSIFFYCSHPLKEWQYDPTSDSGYYYAYARHIAANGPAGFQDLFTWYASGDEARRHPAPVRFGYILPAAGLFNGQGPSFSALGCLSTFHFLLFLYVCFFYVRKYFCRDTALAAVALLASSPLLLGMGRTALVDGVVNLWWAWSVWLFLDVVLRPRAWSYPCFVLSLTAGLLTKETSIVLMGFFTLCAIGLKLKGYAIRWVKILGITLLPAAAMAGLCLWVGGGPGPVVSAAQSILQTHAAARQPNMYAIEYSSGPWFRYLVDFMLLSPLCTLLWAGYMQHILMQARQVDGKRMYLAAYFVFVYMALNLLPHSKVVRFVINLEMVIALFAVFMLSELVKGVREGQRHLVFAGGMLILLIHNWLAFLKIFYMSDMLDPISSRLLMLWHFIPAH